MRAFSFFALLSMTLSCAAASNTLRGLQAAPAAPAGSAPKAAPNATATPAAPPKAAAPAAPAGNATANAPVEIGVRAGTKDSFAGLEDMMRVSVNTLRVKDGQKPLESDLGLSQAALSLAEEMAKKDAKNGKLTAEDEATLLDRAKKAGFKGTIVKANSFSYDAKKEGLDAKNAESHTLAAMSAWSKNANTTAVVDNGSMKMVGSAGFIAASGEAYIVELMGA